MKYILNQDIGSLQAGSVFQLKSGVFVNGKTIFDPSDVVDSPYFSKQDESSQNTPGDVSNTGIS